MAAATSDPLLAFTGFCLLFAGTVCFAIGLNPLIASLTQQQSVEGDRRLVLASDRTGRIACPAGIGLFVVGSVLTIAAGGAHPLAALGWKYIILALLLFFWMLRLRFFSAIGDRQNLRVLEHRMGIKDRDPWKLEYEHQHRFVQGFVPFGIWIALLGSLGLFLAYIG